MRLESGKCRRTSPLFYESELNESPVFSQDCRRQRAGVTAFFGLCAAPRNTRLAAGREKGRHAFAASSVLLERQAAMRPPGGGPCHQRDRSRRQTSTGSRAAVIST